MTGVSAASSSQPNSDVDPILSRKRQPVDYLQTIVARQTGYSDQRRSVTRAVHRVSWWMGSVGGRLNCLFYTD